jgi:hypothetical protein
MSRRRRIRSHVRHEGRLGRWVFRLALLLAAIGIFALVYAIIKTFNTV